jgi:hypothetical protein
VQPVKSGAPQASPVSSIFFTIYLRGIFQAIEQVAPGIRVLSYADDIGLLIAARSVQQAIQFDTEKTEAVLFTRQRDKILMAQAKYARVQIEGHRVLLTRPRGG